MAASDTIRRLWLLKSDLEESPDDDKLIAILWKLHKLPVSISALQETEIGKVVNSFRKRKGIAGEWVNKVVAAWKVAVENEVKQKEEALKRESSEEPDSPRYANGNISSGDSDDQGSVSEDEHDKSNRYHVNRQDSDSDSEDTPVRIKQEKLSSSSDEESENEVRPPIISGRGDNNQSRPDKSKTKAVSEDDLTDSDLDEDLNNDSKESNIENYYKKMLGQIGVNRQGSHSIEQGLSKSSSSSSAKHHKHTSSQHHKHSSSQKSKGQDVRVNEHVQKKKKYHNVSESDEEEDSEPSDKSYRERLSSRDRMNVTKSSSSQSSDKQLKKSPSSLGEKQHKYSSSSSGEKLQKHSSSSSHESGRRHNQPSSSSSEKHKHPTSLSSEKHKSSSSLSSEKHKNPTSSSSEKHKSSSSSSNDKDKQPTSSTSEKHKSSSSSSSEKHKHPTSSSSEKHKSSSSSSSEKHKHPTSSSSEKHKHPTSSSSEKHKSSSSSSSEKHKHPTSSSSEKHKHPTSLSSEKHKSSHSSSIEKHKSSPSSSIEKHKSSPSSSSEKHKHSASLSSEKHKSSPSLSSEKHKSSPSLSSEKHKSSPSLSSEKHKSSPSSSSEKNKHPTSSSCEKRKSSPSSSSEKHQHSTSSSSEKHKSLPSSSSEKNKHPTSSSSEKNKHPTSSSSEKNKHHKHQSQTSPGEDHDNYHSSFSSDKKHYKHFSSSLSGENNHKHSYSSLQMSKSSTNHAPYNVNNSEGEGEMDSSYHAYSTYGATAANIKKEKEEENEYSPSHKGSIAVEYVPSKRIKSEHKDGSCMNVDRVKSHSRNVYLEALKDSSDDGLDTDRYSPTVGWKIKKETVNEDHRYGGTSLANLSDSDMYEPTPPSTAPSYIPSKQIKREKGTMDSDEVGDFYDPDEPYIPTKKIKKKEVVEEPAAQSSDMDNDSETDIKQEERQGVKRDESCVKKKMAVESKSEKYSDRSSKAKRESSQDLKKEVRDGDHKSRKHDKTPSSSTSFNIGDKHSSSSHRSPSCSDKKKENEKKKHSSIMGTESHHSIQSKRNDISLKPKEHSSHSRTSPSISHKPSSSENHDHGSREKKPLTSSSKSGSSKSGRTNKKRKENLFTEGGLDLFSDAIQIKAEPSPPPPSRTRDHNDVPMRSIDATRVATKVSRDSKTSSTSTTIDSSSSKKRVSSSPGPSTVTVSTDSKLREERSSYTEADSPTYSPIAETKSSGRENKKKKRKSPSHLDDSHMSFDDFLNFDETAVIKRKKTSSSSLKKSVKTSIKSSSKSSRASALPSEASSSFSSCLSPMSTFTVPTPPKTVSVTENDILSMLPETQAFYRPLRHNPIYEDEDAFGPVDSEVIVSKSYVRSKVYSGRKHIFTEMKSLYDTCLQVLIDNIDALEYVGGVPYSILKPVLTRCTATQLFQLEDYNPHFIEDSDELWVTHCQRDFKGAEPEEMESYRELYLRKFEEREAKYQKLKATMSSTITKGQAGRSSKLAFVDTVAKPPRDVLRQQKRYGTGCVVMGSKGAKFTKGHVSEVKGYKPSITVPAYNPMSETQRVVKATPPMLARAMQMRKNMRR